MFDLLPSPALIANLDQVEQNIRTLVANNARYNVRVRPHIKTHKSVQLARLQVELGCHGLTCAKLGEAEVMADHGFDDLLIAFPLIGQEKMARLEQLLKRVGVVTIVNSVEGAKQLSAVGKRLGRPVRVLLDLDGGLDRGGLKPFEPAREFARQISSYDGIRIVGLMHYAGNIYYEKEQAKFRQMARQEQESLLGTAELLRADGFSMEILSGGNSFSGKYPQQLAGLTEVRSGNFIFNDCNQLSTGMATVAQCALRVVATIVSRVDEKRVIIDAGSKTLTSDLCGHRPGFGYIVGHPQIVIEKLNEEHGFLISPEPIEFEIGERIEIIPNHACGLPNLVDFIYGYREGQQIEKIVVDARGKNY